MRLPQGSRKSRNGPGKVSTPAAFNAWRAASLSSTTRPKWRPSSGACLRPFCRAMNWSPRSMKAMSSLLPRSLNSNSRPQKASASSMSPTSSATWLKPTTRGFADCAIARSSAGWIKRWEGARSSASKKGRRSPALCPCSRYGLLGRLYHDLDLERRIGELGLDGGARRRRAGGDPGIPHFVHLAPGADVGQPDVGRQDLRLVRAGVLQELVDLVEDLLGLALDVGLGVVGGEPGEIDRVAMDHRARHAGAGVDALDAHCSLLFKNGADLRADFLEV